jgi:hypothetical protein
LIPRHFQITIALLLLAILVSGILIIRLRHGEQARSESMAGPGPQPQTQGEIEHIRILVAYDDDLALRWRDAEVRLPADRTLRAREVLRAVLAQYQQRPSPHPLSSASDIRDVYMVGNDTLLVDTNAAFADQHPSGILLEELTLASLVESLKANVPGIDKVKFVVEGKERETLAGHADLQSFYETQAVDELAQEFE